VPGSLIRNLDTAPGSPYHRGEKVVALTFDDGPSAVYTPQILRILTAARVPASFEITGLDGAAYPGIVRAENAAGMALVNHTWTHVADRRRPARHHRRYPRGRIPDRTGLRRLTSPANKRRPAPAKAPAARPGLPAGEGKAGQTRPHLEPAALTGTEVTYPVI
jgi:peptidoglycan/xylan/chitin deacetylase (PgdA/CDA1 family)